MKARELYEWLGNNTSPDDEIKMEVPCEGFMARDDLVSASRDPETRIVTLSAEEE